MMIKRSWVLFQLEAIFAEYILPFPAKDFLVTLPTLYISGKPRAKQKLIKIVMTSHKDE